MGILQSIFKARDKPARRPSAKNLGGSSFLWGGTTSGKVVNERTAMQMTAVYSCVRILSEAIAGLPLFVYKYGTDGSKEKYLDHPLWRVLHDEPNPEMTSFVFRETMMNHLLLTGNAYAQIIRNARGEVVALYPLMPDRVTVDRDSQGRLYYRYYKSSDDAPEVGKAKQADIIFAPSDILHVLGLGL
jgi:HK97 family phage portal protein